MQEKKKRICDYIIWTFIAILGSFALGVIALSRGETINALWILVAAICVYLIAYRYYSMFIANKVFKLDQHRMTPAFVHNDGLDYVPTNKHVLFGHHFAAIAGAGPLIGPVLAAQMGYLPGMLWILAGVVFAGAVQDFIILFLSIRRDGKSMGDMIKAEIGNIPGVIALFGIFMIMVIILAVLALIVVKALMHSPWGTFTVASTIPIALFMGLYLRYIRPGKVGEISIIGFLFLILAIVFGQYVEHIPFLNFLFNLDGETLTLVLIIYGFTAAVLPIWLLLAPRDYLSTFLKLGTILGLALGIIVVAPELKMPSIVFQFINGGPVWTGKLFPFLFITIACGAVSGFHALISSGTTPKLIENEIQARYIGYGGMLMESCVALMALVAACIIEPGIYYAMNSPAAIIGVTPEEVALTVSSWGFLVTPEDLINTAEKVGENTIISRVGGAPTLAVCMANIFHQVIGGDSMMAFWYHFAILFEALFILTTVDAGTRSGRFILQDLLGSFLPYFKKTNALLPNLIATALCTLSWGYFLYQGVVDPLGGINTLWSLFGIANQMLAAMALTLGTVVLYKMKQDKYAWVTLMPTIWLLICTLTAGWMKLFDNNPNVGFLAHAKLYRNAIESNTIILPARSIDEMYRIITNDYINSSLCFLFMVIVIFIVLSGIKAIIIAKKNRNITTKESQYNFIN
ncbi:Carbon starvation protein A [Candidatus Kinetoplastibacterium sorsogonicusi]|uniref:Carbon starvation protein A n=1 Tax=Candidatus Kinetoplastidibacterium kentomonadis TaxID=1576550 RepID=A0A3S7J9W1_9PROT|nr:carbon starvation CstA family protein [Candidatus Kinetoplastibacterium sorsogonicusi]AWD32451.1 Carbon starvation protein A [Candidatus Kinetoplastibacterium sorsogonicusi]